MKIIIISEEYTPPTLYPFDQNLQIQILIPKLMEEKISIVTDTSSDIPKDLAVKYQITVLNAYVNFGTETFTADDLSMKEFHEKAENSTKETFPTTSQTSAQDFLEAYEKLKNSGTTKILSIHVSGKLSGTINSANIAGGMLDGINIRVIDTHSATFMVAAAVIRAAKLVKKGQTIDQIVDDLEAFCSTLEGFAAFETLDNLVRGGRMSKVRYRFGKLFDIKPVISLSHDELKAIDKTRGVKKAREKAFEYAIANKQNSPNLRYVIGHTDLEDVALYYEDKLKEKFPQIKGYVSEIGLVIGVHAGRGAIFIGLYEDKY